MQVESWPIDKPQIYDKNPRKIPDHAIDKVAMSLREYGWNQPIVVDKDGIIIAGHTRLKAAKKLGLKKVPVYVADLPEDKVRAYRIADNRTNQEAEWDDELLLEEMDFLKDIGLDLALTGFDPDEIADLFHEEVEGLTDPDEVPEPPVNPVSVLGDVWQLGNHRIICGSSTEAHNVDRLLGPVKPHLMVTDPPYGVEYDANWRNDALAGKPLADGKIGGGGRAVGRVENDDNADWREAWVLFPGDVAYIWHAGNMAHIVAESLLASEFGIRAQIIWAKSHFVIGRGDYHPHHEPCWYAVRKGKVGHYNGDRKQSTLWQIDKPQKSETGHSTQKPVECMKRPIENNSSPGQAIYEPFSGSGTTIIAGEMTGRHVYAVELSPAYVDVAIKRWQDFTGKDATLDGDGRTFAEVTAEREGSIALVAEPTDPEAKPKKKVKANVG
jgi:DNA modification methylase